MTTHNQKINKIMVGRRDASRFLRRIAGIATITLVGATAFAQTRTLGECIRIALENNAQVKNSQLDVNSTDYKIGEVKSAFYPKIELNGSFTYYTQLPEQFVNASVFGGPSDEYQKITLNMAQTTTGSVQISQVIYSQAALTGLQAAKAAKSASGLQLSLTRENVVYNVSSTYYTIQVLNDNLARIAENIKNLETSLEISEVLKESEIVSGSSHSRLTVNLENLRNQYENQRLTLDKNVTLLKYLMNISMDETVQTDSLNYTEVLAEATVGDIDHRADIRLQREQVRLAKLDKKTVAAGYYPTLMNYSTFSYTAFNDRFSPFERINNEWINSSYVGYSLVIPVFDGFEKKFKLKQKEAVLQQNINTLSMMQSNAEREIIDAVNTYEINKRLLVRNKTNLDIAEQLFITAQSEYASGITSLTDLLNAQNDLSNARNNYSDALIGVKQSELSLRKANGELLSNLEY